MALCCWPGWAAAEALFGVLAAEPEDPGGGVLTAEWIIPPAEDGAAGGVAREAEEPDKAREAALPPEAPPAWGGGVLAMLADADAVAVVSSRAALGGLEGCGCGGMAGSLAEALLEAGSGSRKGVGKG